MDKVGRNDPCSCGSGKKYKKCCEEKNLSKKINAQLLPAPEASGVAHKVQKISSLFQNLPSPKKPSEKPPEEPPTSPN